MFACMISSHFTGKKPPLLSPNSGRNKDGMRESSTMDGAYRMDNVGILLLESNKTLEETLDAI